jgi:F-type H+-transporting ATPase subunit gamma
VREAGFPEAEAIAKELVDLYEGGKFDVAHLFFSKFRSALLQEPTAAQIIPVPAPKVEASTSGAVVEYEPDEEEILAALLPRYLRTQIFGALLKTQRANRAPR